MQPLAPNPRRLTRLFTQKEDYENFKELIEVVGCIVLPSGRTKDLQALINCGSTDNFINLKLVENLNLNILPLKNGCVSLVADTTAHAAGETRPLTMTLGPHCSHKSKYTVIELGDHNIVLG